MRRIKLKTLLTEEEIKGWRILVDELIFNPKRHELFTMKYTGFIRGGDSGCVLSWKGYTERKYFLDILHIYVEDTTSQGKLNAWFYDESWWKVDNSSVGAAARILYALEYGLPSNSMAIMEGRAPYPIRMRKWIEKVEKMDIK